jgi:hypothetical protein
MDLPVELVQLLQHAGIKGQKLLTWDLQVNSTAVSVKLVWIKAGKPVEKTGETTSQAPQKKYLSPSTRRRNTKRMDQWKAKGEVVGENTTCVQTQTAAINLSQDETTQTDQHNSDAQAINIPTVSTKKGSDRHRQGVHILVGYQDQQNSTRTIQLLSIAFPSIHPIKILVIDHQHQRMKHVAGEGPAKRRNCCPQYLGRVVGLKTLTN